MAFMTKKKRYKFGVQCCLEELTAVPFVSAVLFAKVRLLDGGNFQDHSSRVTAPDGAAPERCLALRRFGGYFCKSVGDESFQPEATVFKWTSMPNALPLRYVDVNRWWLNLFTQ